MARKSKMMKVKEVSASQKNIALYCRVSTRRQAEEGYSIDIQKENSAHISSQSTIRDAPTTFMWTMDTPAVLWTARRCSS